MENTGPSKRDLARSALRAMALFTAVPDAVLDELGDELRPVVVPGGRVLFSRGDVGDSMYLVVSGRLQILEPAAPVGDPTNAILTELGPGDVVGEIALLTDEPRSATARTIRDSELLQLTRTGFDRFVEQHPESLLLLARGLARHLARPTPAERRPSPPRTIALVPLGDVRTTRELVDGLGVALQRFGRVATISSTSVDDHLGPGAAERHINEGSDAVTSWLHERESSHEFLIYEADAAPGNWTQRCLRQADRVLLVADGRTSATSARDEKDLLGRHQNTVARIDLVLVHAEDVARPVGTQAWLAARSVHTCHHLRRGRSSDHQRLARFLAGRAVGLVLGGGGPRGFAHLGVMRALEEAGVPIDAVGGSSIGAVMGASNALGLDHDARQAAAVSAFVGTRFLFGLTLPLVSLSSSRKVTRLLRSPAYFGEVRIEDLWKSYFCVSANLSTAEVVVHDRGELWRAVRASTSIPGILPPVCQDGDVLVDGGVMNNLPADVMHQRIDGGRIIAVDLQAEVDFRTVEPFEPTLSGWTALQWRLPPSPRTDAVPGIVATLMRTMEVGWARARTQLLDSGVCDLVLRPPLGTTKLVDFSVGPGLVDTAYRYTLDRLDDTTLAELRS